MPRLGGVLRRATKRLIPRFAATAARCMSCGRGHDDGIQLVAGPGLYICAECLASELPMPTRPDAVMTVGVCRWCRTWRFSSQLELVCSIPTCSCCRENLAVLAARRRARSRPDT